MEGTTMVYIFFAAIIGGMGAWLYGKSVYGSRLAVLEEQLRQKELLLVQQQQLHDEQKGNLDAKMKLAIGEMTRQILQENTVVLTAQNQSAIGEILKPLKTELGEFRKKVEETYDKESKERFSLGKEIDRLVKMSEQVSVEANNLTSALKGNNKIQGNWGELLLESILENSGLVKGREFQTQEFIRDAAGDLIKDDQGKALQPDVTVYYPDQRKIIIDSKVSLLAWEQYHTEEDNAGRDKAMLLHLQSIRQHIDGLSKKNYPRYAQALDYVLLFIPIEPAFLEAMKKDSLLWKYAYDKKIMLVSPTNLLAVLKIIADLWKVEMQNKNALEIAQKAGLLYDKFVGFMGNLEDVGKKLNDAQSSYDAAFKQLGTGRGNIIGKIEELKKMGAEAEKQLPDRILYELK